MIDYPCCVGYLIADEFPAELAGGAAYVAGLDDDGRPVVVILAHIWLKFHMLLIWVDKDNGHNKHLIQARIAL